MALAGLYKKRVPVLSYKVRMILIPLIDNWLVTNTKLVANMAAIFSDSYSRPIIKTFCFEWPY